MDEGEHIDITSQKPFDQVVTDLRAELSTASTDRLMDRLAGSETWEDFADECAGFAGRSNLIEVGFLDWGRVATLGSSPMKAKLFVLGNPLTARKLLAAGGPEVGLYLPTRLHRDVPDPRLGPRSDPCHGRPRRPTRGRVHRHVLPRRGGGPRRAGGDDELVARPDLPPAVSIEHAAHLLRTTALSTEALAGRVGYVNASTLRGVVRRHRGLTIRERRTGPTPVA